MLSSSDAKRMVKGYAERGRVNITWLAGKMGVSRQTIHGWLSGQHEPASDDAWTQIADLLGLQTPAYSTEFMETAREFALAVLVKSDDPDLKSQAAMLIREISKKVPYTP